MSLQDDLLRNRRIFALLTEPEGGAEVPSAPLRKSPVSSEISVEAAIAEPFRTIASDAQAPKRQSARTQAEAPQRTEIFSLEFGRRVSRETGMSLRPPALEDIAFPELRQAAAPAASDPLEGLYHRLECDARRASQLFGEEDY